MLQRPRGLMRKTIYSGLILTAAMGPVFAAEPNGDWLVSEGTAHIRIAECNGSKWGVVAWEQIPGGTDLNNPDATKRSRPTIGMPILLNMKKSGTDEWEGSVYNAKNGKVYDATIRLLAPDKLEIKGCVLGFLCGGETWTRVIDTRPEAAKNTVSKAAPKTAPPRTVATTSVPPKVATATPSPTRTTGSKTAAAAPANPLDDICLIPEIARPTIN